MEEEEEEREGGRRRRRSSVCSRGPGPPEGPGSSRDPGVFVRRF